MKDLKIKIYDNGGKTLDRLTVFIYEEDGSYSIYGMSEAAIGFDLFCGDNHDNIKPGAHLGKRVAFHKLDSRACKAILDRVMSISTDRKEM
jgi:hypothetical protein